MGSAVFFRRRNNSVIKSKINYHLKGDFRKKYTQIKKIGVGNYTEVWECENRNTDELRAIKIINLESIKLVLEKEKTEEEVKKELKDFIKKSMNEIKFMIICGENNENSVKYYESFENENEFAIVMELCDENLAQLKKKKFLIQKKYMKCLIN